MKDLLEGILVIELGTMITAPLAGMMLADLGARVIKVEHPEGGDPFRSYRGDLYSPHFFAYNRNKQSIQLDLQSASGQRALYKLIAKADVLLDNYRPGVMARLNLDDKKLAELKPDLVRCSLTGFGTEGPYRNRPAYDSVGIALSGIASLLLDPLHPEATGPTIADNVAGMYACYGILGALFKRLRSGKGSRVAVNMLEAAVAFIPDTFSTYTMLGLEAGPRTRVATSQSYAMACADGRLIAIHLSSQDKFWQGLAAVLERPELAQDPRFVTRDLRVTNYETLSVELANFFRTKPRDVWCDLLEAQDVPYAPIKSVREVLADPQIVQMATFYKTHHPTQGDLIGIHRPVMIDGARGPCVTAAPTLGEHTDVIMQEFELR